MTAPTDVIVIGAGIAGLVCATELHRAGLAVDVLEASDGIGGRMRTDLVDGFRCDRGFQLLNPAYPAARDVLDLDALDLRQFGAGVALADGGQVRVLADPLRAPHRILDTLRSGRLHPYELLRLARWGASSLAPARRLGSSTDRTLTESLDVAEWRDRCAVRCSNPS